MTERQAIDYLMKSKGEPLAATAHEGFCAAGCGLVMTDGREANYVPLSLVKRFPQHLRRRLLPLVKSYKPATEVVAVLMVPHPPTNQIIFAAGKRTPALTPEQAFLKWTGKRECPPMRTIGILVEPRAEDERL